MDYVSILNTDLNKGYSKSDLERLIGLPKNNLSGILKGDRKLSRKSELKIEKWEVSEKPNPLEVKFENDINKIKIYDIGKQSGSSITQTDLENLAKTAIQHKKNKNKAVVTDVEEKSSNGADLGHPYEDLGVQLRLDEVENMLKMPKYLSPSKVTALKKEKKELESKLKK